MLGYLLAALLPIAIYGVVRLAGGDQQAKVFMLLLGGYALRLMLHPFIRDLPLFSHGVGGDYAHYEGLALVIARIWDHTGVQYFTDAEFPLMGPTSLPPNLFALVIFLNGGQTSFGCTAVIAAFAALTCLNLYRLAVDLGAEEVTAFRMTALMLFSPAFLYYTSDMYKDGLVLFLIMGTVGSAIRLVRRFSVLHVAIGAISFWGLWHVRFYLCFVAVTPLIVGLAGLGSRGIVRPLLACLLGLALLLVVGTTTHVFEQVTETGNDTFAAATSAGVLAASASQGSGVEFADGGNAFGSFAPKLVYTLFAPFPWQAGSLGLQLGKVEVLIWLYLMFRAWRAAKRLWKSEPGIVLMFLSFLVPTTAMYATIMANIGLIVRERMCIVLVTYVVAMLSWPKAQEDEQTETDFDARPEVA
jgi:hypothetical protein